MTTTESTLSVVGVAAEAMTVEIEEGYGEAASLSKTSTEKIDVDKEINSSLGGGVRAEARAILFDPEEKNGMGGDVGTAVERGFSGEDKINSSGLGERNLHTIAITTATAVDATPDAGSVGKVIHLKLLPATPSSSSSSVLHHSDKRPKKRKKTRSIQSFADFEDENDSRKTQMLSLELLGGEGDGGRTATISGVEEKEDDEKVEGVGGGGGGCESLITSMMSSNKKCAYSADGDDGDVEKKEGLNRHGNSSPSMRPHAPPERDMSPLPQREEDASVGGRLPRSSPNASITTSQQQLHQQQYAQQQLQSRFHSGSSSNSTSHADQKAQGSSMPLRQQQRQLQRQLQQQQPPGWRVKLYRLNADGSWDDCGTGRIQFYYARPHQRQPPPSLSHKSQQLQPQMIMGSSGGDETMSNTSASSIHFLTPSTTSSSSAGWIFRELGEPMLCMRAEVSQQQQQQEVQNDDALENIMPSSTMGSNSSNDVTPGRQKVLLRTRVILLHDASSSAYQCQGGNIITWCEPGNNSNTSGMSQKENDDTSTSSQSPLSSSVTLGGGGVDLALSFQDNAGCKDIWQHITNVQARAREILLLSSSSTSSPSINSNHHQEETGDMGGEAGAPIRDSSLSRDLHHHEQRQHDHMQNSPPKQTSPPPHSPLQHSHHSHSFLHNSPNSPDHDAVEDCQLSSLVSFPLGVGGVMKPSTLFDATSSSFRGNGGHSQHDRHHIMHGNNHATAASNNNINKVNSLLLDHHSSSGDNEPGSYLSSPSSSKEDLMTVYLAASAAATVPSSSDAVAAAAAPPCQDDDASDDDNEGPQPLTHHQHQNHLAPIAIPNDNDGNNVNLHQNQHQPQQQHGFSNTMHYFTNSLTNDNSNNDCQKSNNNININNFPQRGRRHLPSNNPTWNDLSSLRDYINNFQLNQGGGGIGVGSGGGYQQMMNASLMQREELLIYLASNDCANLRKLLYLFHDICGSGSSSNEDDSENDEVGGGNSSVVQFTNTFAQESSNSEGIHLTSLTSPNDDGDNGNDVKRMKIRQRRQEKKDSDDNYARLLANIIKSILLLNDPEIIEYVTSDAPTFELLCAVLEYDPDLRERASHVEFLRRHARFRTVIRIDDDGDSDEDASDNKHDDKGNDSNSSSNHDSANSTNKNNEYNEYGGRRLIANIHRLFRVNYLRDTILRPTMDESNLSTLVSLGQFMMCDIIRGVLAVRRRQEKERSASNMEEEQDSWKDNSDMEVKCEDDAGINSDGCEDGDSYLVRIIRMLGREVHAIQSMKWREKEDKDSSTAQPPPRPPSPFTPHSASAPSMESSQSMTLWKQHVAPRDSSLPSRMIRRSGCLMFLNELFNMARMALQQHEKDDFIETTATMLIPLSTPLLADDDKSQKQFDGTENSVSVIAVGEGADNDDIIVDGRSSSVKDDDVVATDVNCESQKNSILPHPNTAAMTRSSPSLSPHAKIHFNLLSLLSAVLSDPTTDATERGAALDILGVISMHDPGLIRKYCLEYYAASVTRQHNIVRPKPNELGEVILACPTDDLMLSLMYIMATENDAGLSLQTSEIIRIILDTESTGGEQQCTQVQGVSLLSATGGDGFLDEEYGLNAGQLFGNPSNEDGSQTSSGVGGGGATSIELEQNSFLALFYDRYVYWLVASFNYVILVPRLVPPSLFGNETTSSGMRQESKHRTTTATIPGCNKDDYLPSLLRPIEPCPVRASFTLEIIIFCVRAHIHRMKFFMLRTRSLGIILKTLRQIEGPKFVSGPSLPSGVRCLKLASLKLFRSVLSVKDEFYHRHIIQHDLFSPVFDLFRDRSTSVGDNLLSSAILEICDFICLENIKSLIDYIVTKHLTKNNSASSVDANNPSLEDIANPYVETFKQLRKMYNENNTKSDHKEGGPSMIDGNLIVNGNYDGIQLTGGEKIILNEKALEDQVSTNSLWCLSSLTVKTHGGSFLPLASIILQRKFRQADDDDSYFNDDDDAIEEINNGATFSITPVENGGCSKTSEE
ncbi:hypothetical protein ACHAW5_005438 [Stephanodiscus triporus]|uniref:Serine/threonine-protein phosphatase 4 regulatory subunit 3-like central domain-containing protein n=1 Tax=Stephanodiscus triporus TaxID=2934178 RepID=A0ABD3NT01_9STRA